MIYRKQGMDSIFRWVKWRKHLSSCINGTAFGIEPSLYPNFWRKFFNPCHCFFVNIGYWKVLLYRLILVTLMIVERVLPWTVEKELYCLLLFQCFHHQTFHQMIRRKIEWQVPRELLKSPFWSKSPLLERNSVLKRIATKLISIRRSNTFQH